jgi:hypothetical protein
MRRLLRNRPGKDAVPPTDLVILRLPGRKESSGSRGARRGEAEASPGSPTEVPPETPEQLRARVRAALNDRAGCIRAWKAAIFRAED